MAGFTEHTEAIQGDGGAGEHCVWGQGNCFQPSLSHLLPDRLWEKLLAFLSFYLCICNQRLQSLPPRP